MIQSESKCPFVETHACYDNVFVFYMYRCGAGLKALFSSPAFQHFLNCTPMRVVHSEKAIYQPVTLRKVSCCVRSYISMYCSSSSFMFGTVKVVKYVYKRMLFILYTGTKWHCDTLE